MDKIFRNMDRDKDAKLTFDEFVEGSKQDPTIVQVRRSDRPTKSREAQFPYTGAVAVRWSRITSAGLCQIAHGSSPRTISYRGRYCEKLSVLILIGGTRQMCPLQREPSATAQNRKKHVLIVVYR